MKINKKGFTLIEMLAVIVILGLIMSIAVTSVMDYIENSKRKTYISIANQYIAIAGEKFAKQDLVARDSNTVYYVHINNLNTEKGLQKSPYGEWKDAYVVVTIDPNSNDFNYYWTSVDDKGFRVDLVEEANLDVNSIYVSDDFTINPNYPLGGRDKIVVYDKDKNRIADAPAVDMTLADAENCYEWVEDETTGNIKIINYDKTCGLDVEVPSYIDDKLVTEIGDGAFKNKGIMSVKFYKGIEKIGYAAFQGNNLKTVKLSVTVKTVGDYAFYSSKVSELVLSDGLQTIGDYAFASNKICKVTFPSSLTKIGSAAFSGNCLSTLSVPAGATIGSGAFTGNSMSDADAFIYKRNVDGTIDYTTIIGYAGTVKKNVVIPKSRNGIALVNINSSAFKSTGLDGHLDIPDTVTTIGSDAFAFNSIDSVKLPSSLQTLDSGAFRSNYISKFDVPNTVKSLSSTAFNNNSVKGEDALIYARKSDGSVDYSKLIGFAGNCSKTGECIITIPAVKNGVVLKNIGGSAFQSAGIKGFNLPSLSEVPNLTIANNAFQHNSVPASYTSEYGDGGFFYKVTNGKIDYTILSSYAGPGGGVSGTITIPGSFKGTQLTTIQASFTWMSFKKMVIPSSVTTISNGLFGKGASNNSNFVTIVNPTGRSFNWGKITSSSYTSQFVTGTIKHQAGDIEVVAS